MYTIFTFLEFEKVWILKHIWLLDLVEMGHEFAFLHDISLLLLSCLHYPLLLRHNHYYFSGLVFLKKKNHSRFIYLEREGRQNSSILVASSTVHNRHGCPRSYPRAQNSIRVTATHLSEHMLPSWAGISRKLERKESSKIQTVDSEWDAGILGNNFPLGPPSRLCIISGMLFAIDTFSLILTWMYTVKYN